MCDSLYVRAEFLNQIDFVRNSHEFCKVVMLTLSTSPFHSQTYKIIQVSEEKTQNISCFTHICYFVYEQTRRRSVLKVNAEDVIYGLAKKLC